MGEPTSTNPTGANPPLHAADPARRPDAPGASPAGDRSSVGSGPPGDSRDAGFLARFALDRADRRAWAVYDWANSALFTVVVTAVFPPFFAGYLCAGVEREVATQRFAAVTFAGILFSAALAPVMGALADYTATRKWMLGICVAVGAGACIGMMFLGQGDWVLGSVLFFLATCGATLSFVTYNALLPFLAPGDQGDQLSSSGFAVGYVGGAIVLAAVMAMFALGVAAPLAARIGFAATGIWWALFTVPLLIWVAEPPRSVERDESGRRDLAGSVAVALRRLFETARDLPRYPDLLLFLAAFLVYSDGIGTIIRMATTYGKTAGVAEESMLAALLVTQCVGAPAAMGFGVLARYIGSRASICIGLGVYVVVTMVAYFMDSAVEFFILSVMVGCVQGGTQALSRSLFATLVPRHKSGELFGVFGLLDRFSGSMGAAAIYLITRLTGEARPAILFIGLFFGIGIVMLYKVNVAQGRRRAAEGDAQAAPVAVGA